MRRSLAALLILLTALPAPRASAQGPDDLNEGSRMEWDSANSIYRFKWWGRSGRTYFIQQSEDLPNGFSYVPVIESGSNSIKEWGFSTDASRFFLRLKYTDELVADPFLGDSDGDGYSNWEELLNGTDPLDFYNGEIPQIQIVSGNGQSGLSGAELTEPLRVRVTGSSGNPIWNAPVSFVVTSGTGSLSSIPGGTGGNSVEISADEEGYAAAWFRQPVGSGIQSSIGATAGSGTVSFTATTTNQMVSTPACSPDGGEFDTWQQVVVTCATPGAQIHYTTEDRLPVASDPWIASGASIVVAASDIYTFRAFAEGYAPSAPKEASFMVTGNVFGGYMNTYALKPDGNAFSWGENLSGELGDGSTGPRYVPGEIPVFHDPVTGLGGVLGLAPGVYHTTAWTRDGKMWAFGLNSVGQFGNGNNSSSNIPVQSSLTENAANLGAGAFHSLAVAASGTFWATGSNGFGQLGDNSSNGSNIPVVVLKKKQGNQYEALTGVTMAAGGDGHSIARVSGGSVWTFGKGSEGQLGNNSTASSLYAVQVPGLSNISLVYAKGDHCMALDNAGALWAWGWNGYGQLGDGSSTNRTVPVRTKYVPPGESVPVPLPSVQRLSTGIHHALATNGTTLWSWGRNDFGQLGVSGAQDRVLATEVDFPAGRILRMSGGFSYSMLLRDDGSVWIAGINQYGQMGNGSTDLNSHPQFTAVPGFNLFEPALSPVLHPPGGTYSGTSRRVTVDGRVRNAIVRYTTDGRDPDESDPVISGTYADVPLPCVVKVRTWRRGRAPSVVVSGTFERSTADDWDGDGLSTSYELSYGFDPNNAYSQDPNGAIDDGNFDSDGDGNTNLEEWQRGTNPIVAGPLAPSQLQPVLVSGGKIKLSWNDNSIDELTFKVERRTGGGWSAVAMLGANATNYTDISAVPGIAYSYRVVAMNSAGWGISNETAYVAVPNGGTPNMIIHTYDALGRLIWTTQPSGSSAVYQYDGNNNLKEAGNVSN